MSRRTFLKALGGSAALASGLVPIPSFAATGSTGQPNILLLITDEERQGVVLPAGFSLPTRDALSAAGTRFTMHHTPNAPCSPARGIMFTGLHSPINGVTSNVGNNQAAMRTSLPTIGKVLKAAGYRTAYIGKWHLSQSTDLTPYGFDTSLNIHGDSGAGAGVSYDAGIAAAAVNWLQANASNGPWLCVVSLINPHDVMFYPKAWPASITDFGAKIPDNFQTDLSTKPAVQTAWRKACNGIGGYMPNDVTAAVNVAKWRKYANGYLALLQRSDVLLGQVLAAVPSAVQDNTVTIHVGDHGEMGGAHGLRMKGPLIYRENLRVPLVICDPRNPSSQGQQTSALTSHIDLLPTIASLAGTSTAPLIAAAGPGHDLTPLLSQPGGTVRDALLVTSDSHDGVSGASLRSHIRGVITPQYSYGRFTTPSQVKAGAPADLEVYDRNADPGEMNNLAATSPSLVDNLDALTNQLIASELHA